MSILKLAKIISYYEKSNRFAEADNMAGIAMWLSKAMDALEMDLIPNDLFIKLLNLGNTFVEDPTTGDIEKKQIMETLDKLKMKQKNI